MNDVGLVYQPASGNTASRSSKIFSLLAVKFSV